MKETYGIGWNLGSSAESVYELLEPLYDIITCSINTGKALLEWKNANVISINKSGDKTQPLNHKTSLLTTVMCKICESTVKKN